MFSPSLLFSAFLERLLPFNFSHYLFSIVYFPWLSTSLQVSINYPSDQLTHATGRGVCLCPRAEVTREGCCGLFVGSALYLCAQYIMCLSFGYSVVACGHSGEVKRLES